MQAEAWVRARCDHGDTGGPSLGANASATAGTGPATIRPLCRLLLLATIPETGEGRGAVAGTLPAGPGACLLPPPPTPTGWVEGAIPSRGGRGRAGRGYGGVEDEGGREVGGER